MTSDRNNLLVKSRIYQSLANYQTFYQYDITCLTSTPSTISAIKPLLTTHHDPITVCLANEQTQGLGRQGKHWHSPAGKNIYCTVAMPFTQAVTTLSGLSLVVGVALLRTLQNTYPEQPFALKWPNDLYADNKKLAGILVELITQPHVTVALISLGINVNATADDGLDPNWHSLATLTGNKVTREPLIANLLYQLDKACQTFTEVGLSPLLTEWSRHDYLQGKSIRVQVGDHVQQGCYAGINEQGFLLLQETEGNKQTIHAGSIHVI